MTLTSNILTGTDHMTTLTRGDVTLLLHTVTPTTGTHMSVIPTSVTPMQDQPPLIPTADLPHQGL